MIAGSGQRLLRAVLILIIGVSIGALYDPVRTFFNQQFYNLHRFVSGHPLEAPTSVWQKIQNDIGQAPWRASRSIIPSADFDYRAVSLTGELKTILPESRLELFHYPNHPALDGYKGMLIKTPVDTG